MMNLFIKTTIFMIILCFTAHANSFLEGSIGSSKVGYDRTNNINGYATSYSQQHRYDVIGSLKYGTYTCFPDKMKLGYLVDVSLEKSKRLEKTLFVTVSAKRMYILNLLATIAYESKCVSPYLVGGLSYTKFKIDYSIKNQKKYINALGWSLGGGIEVPVSNKLSFDVQYLYTYYGENKSRIYTYGINSGIYLYTPESYQAISFGIKYYF